MPCSVVSQFPTRTPIRRTPFTRRIAAASSGLEQAGIRDLKRDATHCGRTEVDCRCRVLLLFEIDPVSQNGGAVKRQSRFLNSTTRQSRLSRGHTCTGRSWTVARQDARNSALRRQGKSIFQQPHRPSHGEDRSATVDHPLVQQACAVQLNGPQSAPPPLGPLLPAPHRRSPSWSSSRD